MRTGTLQLIWDATTVSVAESFTNDIGDTSTVEFVANNDATDVTITVTDSGSGTWTAKYFRKLL